MDIVIQNTCNLVMDSFISFIKNLLIHGGCVAGLPPTLSVGHHTHLKAQPHAAMLHTCDRVFQSSCDAAKSQ